MNTFPQNLRSPGVENFGDEKSEEAVLIADTASGYPVINKLFTFDPRTFSFVLPCVPEQEKLEIMTFYENNKDVPFLWTNKQDNEQYEVVFVGKPGCRLDDRRDFWRITIELRQSSPAA